MDRDGSDAGAKVAAIRVDALEQLLSGGARQHLRQEALLLLAAAEAIGQRHGSGHSTAQHRAAERDASPAGRGAPVSASMVWYGNNSSSYEDISLRGPEAPISG
eukprot:5502922-Pleurochrysis_carterae.AAC.2